MRKLVFLSLLLSFGNLQAQQYAEKEYYLIDSIEISTLSEGDLKLLESSLALFHSAQHDTSKINAINCRTIK